MGGQLLHFGGFHLDVVAEIEVARVIERHQVDVGVRDIDSDDGHTDFDAGADLFKATSHGAAEAVQLNKEVVIKVEDVVYLFLWDAKHVSADYRIDIEECKAMVGFGHFVAGNLACYDA